MTETVDIHLRRSSEAHLRLTADGPLRTQIAAAAVLIAATFRAGNKVLFAGNGGSAALAAQRWRRSR